MPPICAVCHNAKNLEATECQSCRSIAYCSDSCLESDKRRHDLICDNIVAFPAENPRPSAIAYMAFHLPTDSHIPELVWLQGLTGPREQIKVWRNQQWEAHIDERGIGQKTVTRRYNPNMPLENPVAVDYRADREGWDPNPFVEYVVGGHERNWAGWYGMIYVHAAADRDMTAADLRHVVSYMKSRVETIRL